MGYSEKMRNTTISEQFIEELYIESWDMLNVCVWGNWGSCTVMGRHLWNILILSEESSSFINLIVIDGIRSICKNWYFDQKQNKTGKYATVKYQKYICKPSNMTYNKFMNVCDVVYMVVMVKHYSQEEGSSTGWFHLHEI